MAIKDGWENYRKSEVMLASFAYSMRNINILSGGVYVTAYLKFKGLSYLILGITKGIGAGLLLPSTWDFFANYLDVHGEPLVRKPKSVERVLYATCWTDDFQLSLDRIDEDYPCPNMSIKEFPIKFLSL